ncbi:MAG: HAD family phosphatase [Lachnospiraceae bacterium]|nr:HAD family phosphatase [Lachnospiraceae bacterium]
MSIKCIALDLDRTTLNSEGKLSIENKRTLEELIAKGIEVVIASGRAYATLPSDVMTVAGIRYAVCGNGATVYHVPTGQCIRRCQLSAETLETVLAVTADEIVSYEGFIDGIAYAGKEYVENPVKYGATPQAVAYVQSTRHMQENIVAFLKENKNRLDSMDVIVRDEESKHRIWRKIENATDEVYITSSVEQLLEIADQNAGKKAGVEFVANKLGLRREEIAAFGDADNDIDMLQYAGVGIAMENASVGCKAAADFITKHHAEDGITYGVREILRLLP